MHATLHAPLQSECILYLMALDADYTFIVITSYAKSRYHINIDTISLLFFFTFLATSKIQYKSLIYPMFLECVRRYTTLFVNFSGARLSSAVLIT